MKLCQQIGKWNRKHRFSCLFWNLNIFHRFEIDCAGSEVDGIGWGLEIINSDALDITLDTRSLY